MATSGVTIPARRGMAARVAAGQRIRVINAYGSRWSTRGRSARATPPSGCEWRPAARGSCDSPPQSATPSSRTSGVRFSPCSRTRPAAPATRHRAVRRFPRYRLLGVEGHHDNCRDNLHAALAALGITVPATTLAPQPVHEHSVDGRRTAGVGRTRFYAGELCGAPRGDGSGGRVLRLPPGYSADRRAHGADHRGALQHRVALDGERTWLRLDGWWPLSSGPAWPPLRRRRSRSGTRCARRAASWCCATASPLVDSTRPTPRLDRLLDSAEPRRARPGAGAAGIGDAFPAARDLGRDGAVEPAVPLSGYGAPGVRAGPALGAGGPAGLAQRGRGAPPA